MCRALGLSPWGAHAHGVDEDAHHPMASTSPAAGTGCPWSPSAQQPARAGLPVLRPLDHPVNPRSVSLGGRDAVSKSDSGPLFHVQHPTVTYVQDLIHPGQILSVTEDFRTIPCWRPRTDDAPRELSKSNQRRRSQSGLHPNGNVRQAPCIPPRYTLTDLGEQPLPVRSRSVVGQPPRPSAEPS